MLFVRHSATATFAVVWRKISMFNKIRRRKRLRRVSLRADTAAKFIGKRSEIGVQQPLHFGSDKYDDKQMDTSEFLLAAESSPVSQKRFYNESWNNRQVRKLWKFYSLFSKVVKEIKKSWWLAQVFEQFATLSRFIAAYRTSRFVGFVASRLITGS